MAVRGRNRVRAAQKASKASAGTVTGIEEWASAFESTRVRHFCATLAWAGYSLGSSRKAVLCEVPSHMLWGVSISFGGGTPPTIRGCLHGPQFAFGTRSAQIHDIESERRLVCGIVGFVGAPPVWDPHDLLSIMSGAIAHRGPDGEGAFVASLAGDGQMVGLGHRRLSIIDLEGGSQPMSNEDASVQLVFNGEIYNFVELGRTLADLGHTFTTRSDTEVIVHAYEQFGDAFVDHLRGMFALALWDAKRERLILARDRFGQKPLFLRQAGGTLAFASEIKALHRFPGVESEIDQRVLADYFRYRYVPAPKTLFKGVEKLEAGSIAVWQNGELTRRRYFYPPDSRRLRGSVLHRDPVPGLLACLDDAVRSCMVSDVPFGAFLSGGIDSSVIVALMTRHSGAPINTYSVGFDDERYSELSPARQVAERFSTRHKELIVTYDDIVAKLAAVTRFLDAPVSEPSDIPIYLLACEARRDVKMVLTGEGSDEIFAGYPKHVVERYSTPLLRRTPDAPRLQVGGLIARGMPRRYSRLATAIAAMALAADSERFPRWFGALSPRECTGLLLLPGNGDNSWPDGPVSESRNSPLRKILSFDQISWLPDNLLERNDRMTMAASLEARAPFLDEALVDYVSSLPDRFRISRFRTKSILRDAAASLLPPEIIRRRKVGFRVPVGDWFRGPLRDYLYDHLVGDRAQIQQFVQRKALEVALKEHDAGTRNHEKLLWTLLALEVWMRECLPGVDSGSSVVRPS